MHTSESIVTEKGTILVKYSGKWRDEEATKNKYQHILPQSRNFSFSFSFFISTTMQEFQSRTLT